MSAFLGFASACPGWVLKDVDAETGADMEEAYQGVLLVFREGKRWRGSRIGQKEKLSSDVGSGETSANPTVRSDVVSPFRAVLSCPFLSGLLNTVYVGGNGSLQPKQSWSGAER